MTALDASHPPCYIFDPMVCFEPHDRLRDPQSRGIGTQSRKYEEGRLLHEYNLQLLPKRQCLSPPGVPDSDAMGRGGREVTPVPQATSWLLSEASFVLESEEEDMPGAQGESPEGLSVMTISEDEEGGGAYEHSSESGDEPPVDEFEAFLARFLSPKRRKGDA